MKAITINEPGKTDNLKLEEINKPNILATEVLVKVHAISINPVDYKTREDQGLFYGLLGDAEIKILGWDISGTIVELGSEVTNYALGDQVFGMINFPGHGKAYAEYVAAPVAHITKKPEKTSHPEAAAASLAALTAYQAIANNAKIQKGQSILIHGAAGGVGHYAIQFAKAFGATVTVTAAQKNKQFVLDLGADYFIDYQSQAFEKEIKNLDFVFDLIGGDTFDKSLQILKKGGQIITLPAPLSAAQEAAAEQLGIFAYRIVVHSSADDLEKIASLLEKNTIKSHVSVTFPFEQIDTALQTLENEPTIGKVVVVIL